MTRLPRKLQKDKQREAEIRPIRAAIIAESATLPLWRRDGGTALYYLLSAFEYETQQRLLDARRHRDDAATVALPGVTADLGAGLNAAVHEIYRRHSDLLLTAPPDPWDARALDEGRGTLIYCSRFASVIEALDDVCYGTRNLHVDGTNVSLPFANEGTIEHEAWKTAHGGLIDPQRPADYAVLELEVSPEGPQLWEMMDRATSYIGGHHILYPIPPAVQAFFAARASRAVAAVDLPVAIRVGGYSVDEFRHFFRSLYERAAIHQAFCCRAAVHQAGRQAVGSLALHVTRDQLHADLVSTGVLSEEAFEHILADVIYEVGHSWTVEVQIDGIQLTVGVPGVPRRGTPRKANGALRLGCDELPPHPGGPVWRSVPPRRQP